MDDKRNLLPNVEKVLEIYTILENQLTERGYNNKDILYAFGAFIADMAINLKENSLTEYKSEEAYEVVTTFVDAGAFIVLSEHGKEQSHSLKAREPDSVSKELKQSTSEYFGDNVIPFNKTLN